MSSIFKEALMSTKERIFQSILFELIALLIFVPLAIFFTNKGVAAMTFMSVLLSLIAMLWNYVYNLKFDQYFGTNRLSRSLKMRIGHGLGFELGMVITSFPIMMWILNTDFWTVLALDFGAVVFFLVYAIMFNWVYDLARHYFTTAKAV
jgi:uncharacterized membrane protein